MQSKILNWFPISVKAIQHQNSTVTLLGCGSQSHAGSCGHLWSYLGTLVVWTWASIWTIGLTGTIFNVLIELSVTVSVAWVIVMATLINTLPVDQIVLALTADILRILFIVSARAEVIRAVFTSCKRV